MSKQQTRSALQSRQVGDEAEFDEFWERTRTTLRSALVARYGHERGLEAFAAASEYAWANRHKVIRHPNPIALLYRVGQSRSRTRRRRALLERPIEGPESRDYDPRLAACLTKLSTNQRLCVVLVFAYDMDRSDVAGLLRITRSSVDTHLSRGLRKLRSVLEVEDG